MLCLFFGDKRLADSINYIVKHYSPEAIFVYSTCVTAMVGDDIDMTCISKTCNLNCSRACSRICGW
ncbi:MAG: nitrogenase component 1 [Sulfurimonas sp.]